MRVVIVFEFPEITDPNGVEADEVIESLTEATKKWGKEYDGAIVYIDDASGKV